MKTMEKILNPGRNEYGKLFIKVTISPDGRLSISGVEGPKKNGDAHGGCGQIEMSIDPEYISRMTWAAGWGPDLFSRLLDVWRKWHLNDMRAGCEHQRAENWGAEKLEIITWRLTAAALTEQNRVKSELRNRIKAGETVTATPAELVIINLPWETNQDPINFPGRPGFAAGRYEIHKREEKLSTWVYEKDHPRGVLCKPCPVCGYKFGSAWLKEELPAAVIEFLGGLPESKIIPAWV